MQHYIHHLKKTLHHELYNFSTENQRLVWLNFQMPNTNFLNNKPETDTKVNFQGSIVGTDHLLFGASVTTLLI